MNDLHFFISGELVYIYMCCTCTFCLHSKDKHFQTSPKCSGLDLSLAQLAFEKLVRKDDVLKEVWNWNVTLRMFGMYLVIKGCLKTYSNILLLVIKLYFLDRLRLLFCSCFPLLMRNQWEWRGWGSSCFSLSFCMWSRDTKSDGAQSSRRRLLLPY